MIFRFSDPASPTTRDIFVLPFLLALKGGPFFSPAAANYTSGPASYHYAFGRLMT